MGENGIAEGTAGVAGVGSSSRVVRSFKAPMESNAAAQLMTGIAVANLEGVQATLELTLRDNQGLALATAQVELPPNGHQASFLNQLPWLPAGEFNLDFSDFRGTIEVETLIPVAATVIQTRPGVFATRPVVPGLQ